MRNKNILIFLSIFLVISILIIGGIFLNSEENRPKYEKAIVVNLTSYSSSFCSLTMIPDGYINVYGNIELRANLTITIKNLFDFPISGLIETNIGYGYVFGSIVDQYGHLDWLDTPFISNVHIPFDVAYMTYSSISPNGELYCTPVAFGSGVFGYSLAYDNQLLMNGTKIFEFIIQTNPQFEQQILTQYPNAQIYNTVVRVL
jgi:hypothetical protein